MGARGRSLCRPRSLPPRDMMHARNSSPSPLYAGERVGERGDARPVNAKDPLSLPSPRSTGAREEMRASLTSRMPESEDGSSVNVV